MRYFSSTLNYLFIAGVVLTVAYVLAETGYLWVIAAIVCVGIIGGVVLMGYAMIVDVLRPVKHKHQWVPSFIASPGNDDAWLCLSCHAYGGPLNHEPKLTIVPQQKHGYWS